MAGKDKDHQSKYNKKGGRPENLDEDPAKIKGSQVGTNQALTGKIGSGGSGGSGGQGGGSQGGGGQGNLNG